MAATIAPTAIAMSHIGCSSGSPFGDAVGDAVGDSVGVAVGVGLGRTCFLILIVDGIM